MVCTCQRVPHVEGVTQQQCSGSVNGRGRHELILHAADAACPHRLQERLPQLLWNLHKVPWLSYCGHVRAHHASCMFEC